MYLGIDLGTSGVKALLIDDSQTIIASASGALDVSRPKPGWSEQDPADWISATETALDGLKAGNAKALSAVRGIGFSGQMHGATLLDEADRVLRPCILWNDTRSHLEASALDADQQVRRISGNIVFPGFTAPKLVWVAWNEPDTFKAVRKVLLPKDYLRLWMIGDHVSEMSDASGTAWLDVADRSWSSTLLDTSGMRGEQMPRLVEGTEVSGQLRQELAARWGMAPGVAVAGGAGDNAASAIGMGTVAPGSAFASLGTSGVLFAANGSYQPNPESAVHTFCHALPGTWHQMGVILSATDSLNWLTGITGASAAELTGELGEVLQAPSGLSFLPYLSGERTPHNDADIRGAFTGIGHEADRASLTRALMEGVAFAFRDSLEALALAGTSLDRVTGIGGGSRSVYWLKALATALGIPVDVPADGDYGAAFGAARLGLIAATKADPAAICTAPKTAITIEPDRKLSDEFETAYQRFHALYPAIRGATT